MKQNGLVWFCGDFTNTTIASKAHSATQASFLFEGFKPWVLTAYSGGPSFPFLISIRLSIILN